MERVLNSSGPSQLHKRRRGERLNQVSGRAFQNRCDFLKGVAADSEAIVAAFNVAPALLGADARKLSGARLSQTVLFT